MPVHLSLLVCTSRSCALIVTQHRVNQRGAAESACRRALAQHVQMHALAWFFCGDGACRRDAGAAERWARLFSPPTCCGSIAQVARLDIHQQHRWGVYTLVRPPCSRRAARDRTNTPVCPTTSFWGNLSSLSFVSFSECRRFFRQTERVGSSGSPQFQCSFEIPTERAICGNRNGRAGGPVSRPISPSAKTIVASRKPPKTLALSRMGSRNPLARLPNPSPLEGRNHSLWRARAGEWGRLSMSFCKISCGKCSRARRRGPTLYVSSRKNARPDTRRVAASVAPSRPLSTPKDARTLRDPKNQPCRAVLWNLQRPSSESATHCLFMPNTHTHSWHTF